MAAEIIYQEVVTSRKTSLFFLALAAEALAFGTWRLQARRVGWITRIALFFGAIFSVYTINYRELRITLDDSSLRLKFGLFSWSVPLANVADCRLDVLQPLQRYGGAGIHFMFVDGRYRVNFNFLEHPRVVVTLVHPAGPVQEVSFSTRRPDEVIQAIHAALELESLESERKPLKASG